MRGKSISYHLLSINYSEVKFKLTLPGYLALINFLLSHYSTSINAISVEIRSPEHTGKTGFPAAFCSGRDTSGRSSNCGAAANISPMYPVPTAKSPVWSGKAE